MFVLPTDRVPLRRRRRAPWARRTWRRLRRRGARNVADLASRAARWRPQHIRPTWLTPTRAIAAAVCVVLAGTVWIQWRRGQEAASADAVRHHHELAENAARQGKLRDAHEHYRQMLAALQRLAEPYVGADAIRRRAREVAVLAELCPDTLEAVLALCCQQNDPGAFFAGRYRGTSVVLACLALPVERGRFENDAFELEYRVVLPDHEVVPLRVGSADVPGLLPLEKPQPVVVGVRLDRLEIGSGGKQLWVDASSVLPMTDTALLEACGWRLDRGTSAVVAAQAKRQGGRP